MPPIRQVANAGADPRLDALRACGKALRREAHTLTKRPSLLWQQLYNRLQWEEGALPGILAPQLSRRSAPGAAPWLRNKTRLRESDSLRFTLPGPVRAVEISPNSAFIVTASVDTCKIWDTATGRERATLAGANPHAISPNSAFIVTASGYTCKVWDAETGTERAAFDRHTGWVTACAISPNSDFVVTTSSAANPHPDPIAKIWDAATGKERATLTGHTERVSACAISPDSKFIVTAR